MLIVRIIVGIFLFIHGFCHTIGFIVSWKIATLEEEPYKTTLLSGKVNVGDMGIRVVGVFWLLTALAYAAAAVGVVALFPWWYPLTLWVSLFSLVLCTLGLPGSKYGILANLIILVSLIVGGKLGWLPVLV